MPRAHPPILQSIEFGKKPTCSLKLMGLSLSDPAGQQNNMSRFESVRVKTERASEGLFIGCGGLIGLFLELHRLWRKGLGTKVEVLVCDDFNTSEISEMEDFAPTLNSDWPQRMQVLSLGKHKRLVPIYMNSSGDREKSKYIPGFGAQIEDVIHNVSPNALCSSSKSNYADKATWQLKSEEKVSSHQQNLPSEERLDQQVRPLTKENTFRILIVKTFIQ
ncbi:hypothetical protein JHK82_048563 [Glycine max]|nr:hypothetical protein JHK85_049062 [Glycine max]KAG5098709.1 hypothetical protein JHK82_048563 [Glycine max]